VVPRLNRCRSGFLAASFFLPFAGQIHARNMNVSPDVNFDELARSTDDFNGAMLKVCVFVPCGLVRLGCLH